MMLKENRIETFDFAQMSSAKHFVTFNENFVFYNLKIYNFLITLNRFLMYSFHTPEKGMS